MTVAEAEAVQDHTTTLITDGELSLAALWRYAVQHPDESTSALATALVATISVADLRRWATAYIQDSLERQRRHAAREVEAEYARVQGSLATSGRKIETYEPHEVRKTAAELWNEQQEARDAAWLAEGELLLHDPVAYYQQHTWYQNYGARKIFARKQGRERFAAWVIQSYEAIEATKNEEALNWFVSDWMAHSLQFKQYLSNRFIDKIERLVQKEAQRIRLELTQELLTSTFALGDGARCAWGEATVAQHQQRKSLLVKNMAGNGTTAARHQAAITAILDAGKANLREVAQIATEQAP